MQFPYHPFAVYLFLSALITLIAAIIAWRRSAPGSSTLGWLLLSMTIWSGSYALRWLDISVGAKSICFNIMYIGIVTVPTLFLVFALRLTQHERWSAQRTLWLLSFQ